MSPDECMFFLMIVFSFLTKNITMQNRDTNINWEFKFYDFRAYFFSVFVSKIGF